MANSHRREWFLDMEGVTSSNLVASTTQKPNQIKLLQRENASVFFSFNRHRLTLFSPGASLKVGAKVGNDLHQFGFIFGDYWAQGKSLKRSPFSHIFKKPQINFQTGGRPWSFYQLKSFKS